MDYYFDEYENLIKGSRKPRHGCHGLWFYQNQENYDKYERPYSYSPFFLFGDHGSIQESSADYSDRYSSWGAEKFDAAWEDTGKGKGWTRMSFKDLDRFVKNYYGQDFVATGLVEWCNASNGYPLWSIHFKKGLEP